MRAEALTAQELQFPAEFKLLDVDSEKKIGFFEGYGAVFGNVDQVNDVIQRGAFAETLAKDGMPAMLWQHNSSDVVGVWTEAREDERGLYLKGELNLDVQKAREAHSLLKQKALKGLSIGYLTKDYSLDQTSGIRTLKKIKLLEVSIVTFPANPKAGIAGVKNFPGTIREFERFLRDSGFGKTQAKALASKGWQGIENLQREAADEDSLDCVRRDADEVEAIKALQNLIKHMKGNQHAEGNRRG